ncbi:MAG: PilW family protein [Deltaproteobacteria bacterium]|nr:PilW family protein [Deltaproteobacteria bacterium]
MALNSLNKRTVPLPAGVSLVELLVVMALTLIVAGAAFALYRLNSSYYLTEQANLQLNQNLRAGLSIISRDVRMAGNGLAALGLDIKLVQFYSPVLETLDSAGRSVFRPGAGWFRLPDAGSGEFGVRAVFGVDGGADRPDTLTIWRSSLEYSFELAKAVSFRDGTLQLDGPVPAEALHTGDIVALVNRSQAVIFQAGRFVQGDDAIEVRTDGRYTYEGPPAGFDLTGARAFNLRDVTVVTYFVDEDTSTLMAYFYDSSLDTPENAGRPRPVAANIEDLQVQYYFDNDQTNLDRIGETPIISSDRLNADQVRAVAVGLTAGSSLDTRAPVSQFRPALFNRAAGTVPDSRRRSSLAEIVVLRNF